MSISWLNNVLHISNLLIWLTHIWASFHVCSCPNSGPIKYLISPQFPPDTGDQGVFEWFHSQAVDERVEETVENLEAVGAGREIPLADGIHSVDGGGVEVNDVTDSGREEGYQESQDNPEGGDSSSYLKSTLAAFKNWYFM